MVRRISLSGRLIYGAVVLFLLAGCTSTNAGRKISEFSASTKSVSEGVANAFRCVDETGIAIATDKAVLDISQHRKVDPKQAMQPFLNETDYKSRMAALQALSDYAVLLNSIMGEKPVSSLDSEIDRFASSLYSLFSDLSVMTNGTSYVPGNEVGVLASCFNEIAKVVIDNKRAKNSKLIISSSDPYIQKICNLLKQDIGTDIHTRGLRSQLYASYDKLMEGRYAVISTSLCCDNAMLAPRDKRTEIGLWLSLVNEQKAADEAMVQLSASLEALQKAHGQLVHAFDSSSPELDQSIAMLKVASDRLMQRFNKLKRAQ